MYCISLAYTMESGLQIYMSVARGVRKFREIAIIVWIAGSNKAVNDLTNSD